MSGFALQRKRAKCVRTDQTVDPEFFDWYWPGYIRPGDMTLLTSFWKAGKTTLICGVLRAMAEGQPFLDSQTRPAQTWLVSEESESHWQERLELMPVDKNLDLICRPFAGQPTSEQWNDFLEECLAARKAGELDLLVIDPLASFLPGYWESDAIALGFALKPLQVLCQAGVAVLLLHHPRKEKAEVGHAARGSGALLAKVDINLELRKIGTGSTNHRLLLGSGRRKATPERITFEWISTTGEFKSIDNLVTRTFEENWQLLLNILNDHTVALTHHEFGQKWPLELERPSATTLYSWLNRAFALKRIRREGKGTKQDPYRYRLEDADDKYYDRGELPPLKALGNPGDKIRDDGRRAPQRSKLEQMRLLDTMLRRREDLMKEELERKKKLAEQGIIEEEIEDESHLLEPDDEEEDDFDDYDDEDDDFDDEDEDEDEDEDDEDEDEDDEDEEEVQQSAPVPANTPGPKPGFVAHSEDSDFKPPPVPPVTQPPSPPRQEPRVWV